MWSLVHGLPETPKLERSPPDFEGTHSMLVGTVKFFNEVQGFGLISSDTGSGDVFVDVSALERAGVVRLSHGQRVEYDIELDRHGRAAAKKIQVIPDVASRTQASHSPTP